jgi:predicted RNA-binding Zn ribbon-like protein
MIMRLAEGQGMEHANYQFQFIAGHLALDFVNTVGFRADSDRRADHLLRAEDVYRWAEQSGLAEVETIGDGPRLGAAALRRIREVREQLFAVFHAIASGETIPAEPLARIGTALHDCRAKQRLSVDGTEVRWVWRANARAADHLLHPVLSASVDLLTSTSRERVRQCEDAHCGWLFLDRSNARKRRWCSMADCGNRNKVRNFYRREADVAQR